MDFENIFKFKEKFVTKENFDLETFKKICSITSNIENSNQDDMVFYNQKDDKHSQDIFKEKLLKSKAGIIVTNVFHIELTGFKYMILQNKYFLEFQKVLADLYYPLPKNEFKIIGVTGTNGKTSVVNLCTQILAQHDIKSYSIGTMGVVDYSNKKLIETGATTPSYIELRKILSKFSIDYKACFLEISSHALDQNRLYDLKIDAAGWTSFSHDHIDYHESMEQYFDAKLKIASELLKDNKILLVPSSQSDLYLNIKKKILNIIKTKLINSILPLEFKVQYNLDNLELATDLCRQNFDILNIDYSKIYLPKGRFSTIPYRNNFIIIDYAHTPDALENICKAIRDSFPLYKLCVVFGCGGDRDKFKRPLMAKSILSFAHKFIITSDNPRFENPSKIISDITMGIPREYQYLTILDRKEAIVRSLSDINENEIILIAGKGHEEYQDVNGIKSYFSDFDIVNNYIKNNKA